jgi:hypothetical protein
MSAAAPSRHRVLVAAASILSAALAAPAVAAASDGKPEPQADKSAFTLFNPTPRELMRELSADRPDRTESPYTVDAGHLQVELSFAEWQKGGGREELAVLPTNVKVGLTNNIDVQFLFNPYLRQVTDGDTDQGAGDSQVRLKVNLWGNDGGPTALAVIPFVQIPTGADAFSTDHVEGGIIVPLTIALPAEFALTVMGEVDFVRDDGDGYDTLLVHTASLGRDIAGPLGAFVEYAGIAPVDGDGRYEAYLNTGLTYGVGEDVQFDVGVEVGLNSAADDLRVYSGVTFRL